MESGVRIPSLENKSEEGITAEISYDLNMYQTKVYYMNMSSYRCCASTSVESNKIVELVNTLKIVTEPNRLRLLCVLRTSEHCVCELEDHTNLSQSLISHHLRDLKDAGIVTSKKKSLRVYYSLTKKGRHIINTLFSL